MQLIIMRHGEATPAIDASLQADENRPLSANGVKEVGQASDSLLRYFNSMLAGDAGNACVNCFLASSHLVRARQTAALLAEKFESSHQYQNYRLLPQGLDLFPAASPSRLLEQLDPLLNKMHEANHLDDSVVILCSHRPLVDRLVQLLLADENSLTDFTAPSSWVALQGDWPVRAGMERRTYYSPE